MSPYRWPVYLHAHARRHAGARVLLSYGPAASPADTEAAIMAALTAGRISDSMYRDHMAVLDDWRGMDYCERADGREVRGRIGEIVRKCGRFQAQQILRWTERSA